MEVWKAGKTLRSGDYSIISSLASGGFGITYLAQSNINYPRKVVIKTLHGNRVNDNLWKLKFEDEAERLKKVSSIHPNIVNFIDSFYEDNSLCIVMDFIEGEDLETFLRRKRRLKEKEALEYIHQISGALSVIHKRGLIHRDIKPSNIVLCSTTKRCILIDFGIAREFEPAQMESSIVLGTRGFAPIEQCRSKQKRGPYTDVYALSATLYVLLTGAKELPESLDRQAAKDNGLLDPLRNPKKLQPDISLHISHAIMKGMEVYPEDRPSNVSAWLKLLNSKDASDSTIPTISDWHSKLSEYYRTNPPTIRAIPNIYNNLTEYYNTNVRRLFHQNKVVRIYLASFALFVFVIYLFSPNIFRINFSFWKGNLSKLDQLSESESANANDENLSRGTTETDENRQKVVIDYSKLETYLSDRNFSMADEETFGLLLSLARRNRRGWLDAHNLDSIPCEAMIKIDNLWLDYSDGLYGFSVQRRMWIELGGELEEYRVEIADQFLEDVKWGGDHGSSIGEGSDQIKVSGYFPLKANSHFWNLGVPYFAKKLNDCEI